MENHDEFAAKVYKQQEDLEAKSKKQNGLDLFDSLKYFANKKFIETDKHIKKYRK